MQIATENDITLYNMYSFFAALSEMTACIIIIIIYSYIPIRNSSPTPTHYLSFTPYSNLLHRVA